VIPALPGHNPAQSSFFGGELARECVCVCVCVCVCNELRYIVKAGIQNWAVATSVAPSTSS
jgi:hypothetical protein